MSSSELNILKRKRDPPFQPAEKNNLVDIVAKYFSIVECKKTDAITNKAKNEEWKKIAMEFNATSSFMERDWQVLITLWENLKKPKSLITQQNQEMIATGGGPPKKAIDHPIWERVVTLIRPNIEGYNNDFDTDADITVHYEDENPDENVQIIETNTQYDGDDWSNYTPQMLRKPRTASLRQNETICVDRAEVAEIIHFDYIQPVPTSNFEDNQKSAVPACSAVSKTPNTPKPSRHATSRRRPVVLKQIEADLLAQAKIKILTFSNEQALQQHETTMKILTLQEAQEKEKLKQEFQMSEQEKLRTERTELLRIELAKAEK